jgi:hypothetical protein
MKRRTIALSLALATIALALAACGSKTTSPATSSGAPVSSAAPPTAAEFKAYVTAIKPVIEKARMADAVLQDTLAKLSQKPNNSWDTAATNLTQQGVFLGQASDALAAVTPPPAFAELNKQAVQGLLLQEDVMRAIGSLLAARTFDPQKIDPGITVELKQAGALIAPWRLALNDHASAFGMPVPGPY